MFSHAMGIRKNPSLYSALHPQQGLTPRSKQIFPSQLPGQELKSKADTGRHLWSRHNMLGPQGVPSST